MPTTSPDIIYRYQPMRPDVVDLIRTGRLWFSDPSRFNDPFDFIPSFKKWEAMVRRRLDQSRETARWSEPFISLSRSEFLKSTEIKYQHLNSVLHNKFRDKQRKFRGDFAKHFRVTCFSTNYDNILMWSHYASYHSGISVGIRPAKMQLTPEKALRWKVTYRNKRLSLDHKKPNEIAFRKGRAWKYENEWRILMAKEDLKPGKRPLERHSKKEPPFEAGYFFQLPWDAFESVRFGALMDRKKRTLILKVLQAAKRRHIRAIQMHLSVDRFNLEEEVLR